jgi:hypothetical protein
VSVIAMKPTEVVDKILSSFDGVTVKSSWGETSLFYNPGKILPNGIYFCTIKEQDGDNDKASHLDRPGVYRLSIGIDKTAYKNYFGIKPKRPAKGCIIDTVHDFTALNELMPHPIYGWMSWVQVLNPSSATYNELLPLLTQAHANAILKFNKKQSN